VQAFRQILTGGSVSVLAISMLLMQQVALAGSPWGDSEDRPGNRYGKNKAPTIQGIPSSVAEIDQYYSFSPESKDREGDTLTFVISNKPEWAAFDTANGFLSGYPEAQHEGSVTDNIIITVTDGTNLAALPAFSISVTAEGAANSPPTIAGTPKTEVVAATDYDWTPQASDPDGDPLTFSGTNIPSWANINAANGRIHGLPGPADVGNYDNIRVIVSDGQQTDTTPSFSISVVQTGNGAATISWTAPDTNTDGSALTDLSGFRVHYGTATRNYDQVVDLSDAGTTTAVIENLSLGDWYFAVTALNSQGVESDFSEEVQRVVQ